MTTHTPAETMTDQEWIDLRATHAQTCYAHVPEHVQAQAGQLHARCWLDDYLGTGTHTRQELARKADFHRLVEAR